MAKIIFRSNTVNNGYTIGYDSIEAPDNSSVKSGGIKKTAKIKVSPRSGFIIDANNFTSGLLPSDVRSVKYNNSSSNIDDSNEVIVDIELSNGFVIGKNDVSIEIPISGQAVFPSNEVMLIVETKEHTSVISSTTHSDDVSCGHSTSPVFHHSKPQIKTTKTEYTASGDSGSKIHLLQKTFTASTGYYFSPAPSYRLKTINKSNYNIKIYNEYDSEKRLVARTFNVYYTFPKERIGAVDSIVFASDIKPIIIKKNEPGYKETKTSEIYTIDKSSKVGPEGGIQFIKVKGTPGAKYKLLIQNKEKQIYDFEKGAFVTGGKHFEGEIPGLDSSSIFGTAVIPIVIPAINTNTTSATSANYNSNIEIEDVVETRLMPTEGTQTTIKTDDKRVDVQGRSIGGVTAETTAATQGTRTKLIFHMNDIATDDFTPSNVKFRKLDADRRVISETDYTGRSIDESHIHIVGVSGDENEYIYEIEYEATYDTPASNKVIRIVRQPRFVLWDGVSGSDSSYRAWACSSGTDCEDTNNKLYTSTGKTIHSDWQLFGSTAFSTAETSNYENEYKISTVVTGNGEPEAYVDVDTTTSADFYETVNIRHTISNVIHGKRSVSLELKHKNFLSFNP